MTGPVPRSPSGYQAAIVCLWRGECVRSGLNGRCVVFGCPGCPVRAAAPRTFNAWMYTPDTAGLKDGWDLMATVTVTAP